MSDDFLSKFSNDNYNNNKQTPVSTNTSEIKEKKSSDKKKKEKQKKVIDTFEEVKQETISTIEQERAEEDVFVKTEETEVDPTYKKRKRKRLFTIISLFVVAAIIIGTSVYFISTVNMIDLTNKSVSEARKWAQENSVTLEIESVFTLEHTVNTVISQSVEANQRISRKKVVSLEVSKGADPDEVVTVSDFKNQNVQVVQQWMDENKLENVIIQRVYSDTVDKDVVIDIIFNDKDVTNETYKRKNRMTVTVSQGKETFEKNIVVPSFKDKSKGEVLTWHNEKKFINEFIFEEQYHDTILEGQVISQSISADSKLSRDEVITFVISKGKALLVPNYYGTNKNSFSTVNTNGVSVTQVEFYSDSVSFGNFMWQSIAGGVNVSDEPNTTVKVAYSLGRPYITSLNGKTPKELEEFFFEMNSKGTSITYQIEYGNNGSCQNGQSYSASKENQYVSMKDHIVIYVGRNCPVNIGD